jgi:hypothetical protein
MRVLLESIQASSSEERLENLRKLRSLVTQSDLEISQDGKFMKIGLFDTLDSDIYLTNLYRFYED